MGLPGSNGYIKLRRGLYEHVRNGKLSFFEASLFAAMTSEANPSDGICYGSAGLFAQIFVIQARVCRKALESLEEKGYIKRFPTPGKHGSYPILINKYECSSGARMGTRLNALKSESYTNPYYELCQEDVEDSVKESVEDDVKERAARIENENKKENEKPLSRGKRSKREPSPDGMKHSTDPRHIACKEAVRAYWKSKNPHDEMPWDGREGKALGMLLGASPDLTPDRVTQLLRARYASEVNHSDRPSMWLPILLSYAAGPLDRFKHPKSESNGHGGHSGNGNNRKTREELNNEKIEAALKKLDEQEAEAARGFQGGISP